MVVLARPTGECVLKKIEPLERWEIPKCERDAGS